MSRHDHYFKLLKSLHSSLSPLLFTRLFLQRRQNEAIKRVIDGLRHDKLQRQRILRGLVSRLTLTQLDSLLTAKHSS